MTPSPSPNGATALLINSAGLPATATRARGGSEADSAGPGTGSPPSRIERTTVADAVTLADIVLLYWPRGVDTMEFDTCDAKPVGHHSPSRARRGKERSIRHPGRARRTLRRDAHL